MKTQKQQVLEILMKEMDDNAAFGDRILKKIKSTKDIIAKHNLTTVLYAKRIIIENLIEIYEKIEKNIK